MKPTITAIVITKNEEERIGACLASLSWATEIIVVDNGSTDKTVKISKEHRAAVYETKKTDFALIRELGLHRATGQWVLYVDADERIPEALKNEITKTMALYAEGSPVAYFVRRDTWYLGNHWPEMDRVERLFLRSSIRGWHGSLHETPLYVGEIGILNNPLLHDTHRTIEEMVAKTNEWSAIEAALRLDAQHPAVVWWRLIRVMITGFSRSYFSQGGWRAGTVGWIESIYQGYSMFITYAKLWELQQKKDSI